MIHASLFSGIGGFDLAAELVGWLNAFNCEIDPFCQRVLKYHFPNAAQYNDIKTIDFTVWRGRLDILTGGFPCQPFSNAGKQQGTADNRYLWPEMLRAIQEIPHVGLWAKTFGGLLVGRTVWYSNKSAMIWKISTTKYSRSYFQLVRLMRRTKDNGCGLSPTVQTQGLKVCKSGKTVFFDTNLLPTPTTIDSGSGRINKSKSKGSAERPTLAKLFKEMLPTPKAQDSRHATRDRGRSNLGEEIAEWGHLKTGKTSQLNPLFVAEMMGFPTDWTALPFQSGEKNPSKPTETPL